MMTATRISLVTPDMATPQNWRQALLRDNATWLDGYFDGLADHLDNLAAEVGDCDMDLFFQEQLMIFAEFQVAKVYNDSPNTAHEAEATALVHTWLQKCFFPDLRNSLGALLITQGTAPAISLLREHIQATKH